MEKGKEKKYPIIYRYYIKEKNTEKNTNPGLDSYFNNAYKYDFLKKNIKNKKINNKNNRNNHIFENKNINKKIDHHYHY